MHLVKRLYHSAKTALCCKQNFAAYYEPQLMSRYSHHPKPLAVREKVVQAEKVCIYMVDETDFNPGLCDKLRGILSLFYLCSKHKLKFKINWVFPFKLTDYLIPNQYDWTIEPNAIRYCPDSRPIVIDYAPWLFFQEKIDNNVFRKRILKTPYTELHVYSNTIIDKHRFKKNFNYLFKPSQLLADTLEKHTTKLGNNYISFSLRFMELLGDFKDQEGVSKALSESEQHKLINKCAEKLLEVLKLYPQNVKAFVASDSRKFLDYISTMDSRIYTVPGEIIHIRYKGSEDAYLKLFVDLFLLKEAETRFLLKTGAMYNSGFPRFASWIGNNNFCLIEF